MPAIPTIGEYLLDRLYAAGVAHVFGVPGDYVLKFYEQMVKSPIQHVGTTREDTAAFAADGYARCRGLGALAVTYGVGALNVVNAIAGAHAESSPVVVISGAPGIREQREDPLIHHRFGPFTFQREIFDRITCASAVLDDPAIAFRQIDRTLAAARHHGRPVYIELPRDVVELPGYPMPDEPTVAPSSDPAALDEAVAETVSLLEQSKAPVLIAGVELHRTNLQDTLVQLVDGLRLPIAATLTGKSVIGERHPAYLGVYEGAMGPEAARARVEAADALLLLGVALNDVDLGVYTAQLDPKHMVRASQGEVMIRHHRYPRVQLRDFVPLLLKKCGPQGRPLPNGIPGPTAPGFPEGGAPMKISRLIGRLNDALTPETVVVCDTGDCLFAAVELRVHERTEFLASAFYTTMGFGMPAALGAAVARPDRRPLVLVGDGAFQMTGTEISTLARIGSNAIVIVFNNAGYSTERFILDGPFNDVAAWRFHRIGELVGNVDGYQAATEEAFEEALRGCLDNRERPSLIEVHLSPSDPSPAMQRLALNLRAKVGGEDGS
jgi:TPP-dependent 2-oxoacid decarboxylase